MFKNYVTIAIRNLLKRKGFSLINITGLAIGIAVCLLIVAYVYDEFSYDRFHEKSDRIGRIVLEGYFGNSEFAVVTSPAPMAETLVADYPEVEAATRIRSYGYPVLRYKDNVFSEEKFYSADSTFFDVFTVEFMLGDKNTALTQPNTMIITERMANKYFGKEDPIGKILNSDRRNNYEVVGVVKEFPSTSHFHFDFLLSLASNQESQQTIWLSNNFHTYFVLREGSSFKDFEAKIGTDLVKYIAPQVEQATGSSWDELMERGSRYQYYVQPLTDIHLYNNYQGDLEPQRDAASVYIFAIIAVGILLIACINFMNLSTAKSTTRAKEVGVRKTMGSSIGQLIRQFLSESVIMSFIAIVIASILVKLMLPLFNELAGKQLEINFFTNPFLLLLLILLSLVVGILAGIYPALFLSSFNPVSVLGSKLKSSTKGKVLRSGLVILQFTISIILFIGTFVVSDQLEFIQNKKLGYNKEQLIVIHKADDIGRSIKTFKEQLKNIPGVESVANSTTLPGYTDLYSNAYRSFNAGGDETQVVNDCYVDYGFAETLQLKLAEGRFYSEDRSIDTTNTIVINEAAIKTFGLTEPVGSQIVQLGTTPEQSNVFTVVGVVEDFHAESLHKKIRPMVINLLRGDGFGRYVSVRLKTQDLQTTLDKIEAVWSELAGNQAFEFTFYDEDFARIYDSETRTGRLFTIFSVLAIIVACLGLLGLATYTAEQRTKEIGIRKAMGARVSSILILLSKEFTKWVIIANIIAWPVAYYLMKSWLENFEFRTEIGIGIFIVSGILAIIVAIISVSTQTLKAAIANPVKALKYE